jgi:DNA-binding PadR family transcriptional regulator
MGETTSLDRALLRALHARPRHAYALAQETPEADRATVYRRVASLERRGLLASRPEPGSGPKRRVLRLTAAGVEALRAEMREALRLLMEGFDAAAREPHAAGASAGRGGRVEPPVVFVTGSRASGVELRIVRHLAREHPRAVHLVVPPGFDLEAPRGVAAMEAPWTALPFRGAYARTLFVNELPPARAFERASREWARVLAPGGRLFLVAPAPLPRGVDPFVDWFASLQDELFPDQAGAPEPGRVEEALRGAFGGRVSVARQGSQLVWTAGRGPRAPGAMGI